MKQMMFARKNMYKLLRRCLLGETLGEFASEPALQSLWRGVPEMFLRSATAATACTMF